MSKKKIIAIITIIVLLLAAGISVGVFLYGRAETQATDGSQTTDQNQDSGGNQDIEGTLTDGNVQNPVTNPEESEGNSNEAQDNETVQNDNENAENNTADNNTANNNNTVNNQGNAGNTAGNTIGATTDTNLDNIGETTVTRVEEQERLISEDFLDWWQPMTVAVKPTEVGVELPQISVKKAAITGVGGDQLVYIGDDITYVIAVTNNGKTAVENIEITDRIPENTTYVADSIEDAIILKEVDGKITSEVVGTKTTVEAENKVVGVKWVVSIPAGETILARFTVNVNKTMLDENEAEVETTGTILNTAIANGEESNEVQTSIIRTHKSSVVVRNGNIVDSKTAKVGDLVTYTISIENTGDVEGSTYVIDNIPEGTQFISAEEDAIISEAKDSITWSVTIPAHTTITREFTVEVISVEGLIRNIADVGGTPTNEDIIDTANIDVIKTATAVKRVGENEFTTPVGEVRDGDIIEYTIVVTNTGSRDLTNVLLEEQLDRVEVTKLVVDDVEKPIEKDVETGKLIIGDLKAAKEATEDTKAVEAGVAVITATYTVSYDSELNTGNEGYKDGTLEFIYNKVRATGETIPKTLEEVPEQVEDDDDETVPVIPDPNFTVEKTAIKVKRVGESEFVDITGKVRPGDILKYEIVITNTGNTKLTNIEVRDTLDVRVDEYDETEEPIIAGNIIKVIPSLVSGAHETITTYYEVNQNDITFGKVNEEDLIEIEVIKNIVTAKPEELNEKDDDEIVPVNPNTKVEGTKTWDDNINQDGKRPESITIRLLADGEEVQNKVVTVDDNWSWLFDKLPVYDGENKITYTITEDAVAEYTTNIDGYNVTNIHVPETTVIEGIKTWDDSKNQDGKRPQSITIRLLADGEEVKNEVVTVDDDWSWKFENLPVYENGKKLDYTITEDAVEDYTTNIDGFNVTNTHVPETRVIEGTKTWDDNDNQDGKRPSSITIRLLADGEEVQNKVVTANDNNWSWKFENLPVYENGKKLDYTITEDAVTEYTTNIDGFNVTNKHVPETRVIEGTKTWDDSKNQDGKRPESITIRLLADGEEVKNEVVTVDDDWSWKFENLPVYENGKKLDYTITEDAVEHYTTNIDGFNVTNTHVPETTKVEGTKTWVDNNNQDRKRPSSITIRLLADGKEVKNEVVTVDDNWSWKFENLPVYENGNKLEYTITEDQVSGYSTPEINGYNVTNTILQQYINISGTKTWYAPGTKYPDITIRLLYENGIPFKNKGEEVVAILKDGASSYSFNGLPKYKIVDGKFVIDDKGNFEQYVYTVSEDPVDGYTSSKDPQNEYNFINTIKQEKISINGTKTWDDNNNQDGLRPENIVIRLWADGKELKNVKPQISKEQDVKGIWTYTFTNLNKYSETGKEIKYTITEDAVIGYETLPIKNYNITNKHIPETITVKGTKTWNDSNNKYGKRPNSIEIQLYKTVNGGTKQSMGANYKVTLKPSGANNQWQNTESYEWKGLPRYEGGKEITYTVEENVITDYTPTYTTTKVTNGVVTANIKNTWRQDITGTITTVEETEVPLDVVFVLDISSSMLQKDNKTKTRAQYMIEATNNTIKELMKSPNNRIAVVLFNSNVYQLTDKDKLKHYNADSNGNYITYSEKGSTDKAGAYISFAGKSTKVTVPTNNDWYACGTYTQGGIKTATSIFKNSSNGTTVKNSKGENVIRKPVMILLTDGDPTHYETETAYNKYGTTKYPTWGIAKLRYITPEYYAYTMKTMEKSKTTIKNHYKKACELYTVGINMQGTMAKALLEPSSANINHLSDTTNSEVSPDIHNHDDNGNQHSQYSHVDADGKWRKNAAYYKYQATELEGLLTSNNSTTKVTPGYVNKAYTNSTSGDIANNFADIVRKITEVKIVITDELYGSDRRIELDGFNPTSGYNQQNNAKNVYSLKIKSDNVNVDTKNINDSNSKKYIKQDPSTNKYYLVLTDVLGNVQVELSYHK